MTEAGARSHRDSQRLDGISEETVAVPSVETGGTKVKVGAPFTGTVHMVAMFDRMGGAARSAWRLYEGLRAEGIRAKLLVERVTTIDFDVSQITHSMRLPARIRRTWRRGRAEREARVGRSRTGAEFEIFSSTISPEGGAISNGIPTADVLNLHWVAGVVDDEGVVALSRRMPIVWTLHDMHPLTGGCHYDAGCGRYQTGCHACPQLGTGARNDGSERAWRRKKKLVDGIPDGALTFVAPSRWLADCVRSSAVYGRFAVQHIPYGLNLDVFKPRSRALARELLGLTADERVICWAAGSGAGGRKGFSVLKAALESIPSARRPTLLLVGEGGGQPPVDAKVRTTDRTGNDALLSLWYSAADVTVVPSLQDNLPNVVLESLACGTPVIGSEVGGIPDAVSEGETGRLVPAGDVRRLAIVLEETLSDRDSLDRMARAARRRAEAEWSQLRQALDYAALFRRLKGA